MNGCLSEEALLSILESEGTEADLSHLAECRKCSVGFRRLERDLGMIVRALEETPPAKGVNPVHFLTPRWLPAAMSLAVGLLLITWGVWKWHGSFVPGREAADEIVWEILDEVPMVALSGADPIMEDPLGEEGPDILLLLGSSGAGDVGERIDPYLIWTTDDPAFDFFAADTLASSGWLLLDERIDDSSRE